MNLIRCGRITVLVVKTHHLSLHLQTQSILNLYLTPGDRTEDPAVMDIQEPFFRGDNKESLQS